MYGAIPTSTTYLTFFAGIRPTHHFASVIFYNHQVPDPNRRNSAHETDL